MINSILLLSKNLFLKVLAWIFNIFRGIIAKNSLTNSKITEVSKNSPENLADSNNGFFEDSSCEMDMIQKAEYDLTKTQINQVKPIQASVRSLDKEFGGLEKFDGAAARDGSRLANRSDISASIFSSSSSAAKSEGSEVKSAKIRKKAEQKADRNEFSELTSQELSSSRKAQIDNMETTNQFRGSGKESMIWREKLSGKGAGPKFLQNPNSQKNKSNHMAIIAKREEGKNLGEKTSPFALDVNGGLNQSFRGRSR